MDKIYFYLGALLHDIGQFIERAENNAGIKEAEVADEHRQHGADFVKELVSSNSFLNHDVVKDLLYRRRSMDPPPKDVKSMDIDVYLKMIGLARQLASPHAKQKVKYRHQENHNAKLLSIFSQIGLSDNNPIADQYLEPKKLTIQKNDIFPDDVRKVEAAARENEYPELVNAFYEEFQQIENETQLFYLLEKYLWAAPARTPFEINGKEFLNKPDVSLFDHLRTTAAIALCLFGEHKAGKLTDDMISNFPGEKIDIPVALLLQVDFSGIQSFIFNVQSKHAARNLKGRSYYLQLLSDIIARYVLNKLELPVANLLYNGGGNFYILLPKSLENELREIQTSITTILATWHRGEIYAAAGWVDVTVADFQDFSLKWKAAAEETGKQKANRFYEIGYKSIFDPYTQEENWGFEDFTDQIKKAKAISIIPVKEPQNNHYPFDKVYAEFGYQIKFHENIDEEGINSETTFRLNDTDFLPGFAGFKFSIINLPENIGFDKMAEKSKGDDNKLAVLKMDVDNLGKIFQDGFDKEERSISRLAALSRMFSLFFEGYLETYRQQYSDKLYIIYTGGDDTFLIGSWNTVFKIAEDIQKDFKAFTCRNPDINISASLTVVHKKHPIIRSAYTAESGLEKAKSHRWDGETEPSKNKITILDEVFSWKEFQYIKDFKETLCQLIDHEDPQKRENRSLLQKVYNSARGFSKLMQQAQNGPMAMARYWRFNYYLRTMKSANDGEKKRLIEIYENLLMKQFYEKEENKVKNHQMLIPVAARWAEWETKPTNGGEYD